MMNISIGLIFVCLVMLIYIICGGKSEANCRMAHKQQAAITACQQDEHCHVSVKEYRDLHQYQSNCESK